MNPIDVLYIEAVLLAILLAVSRVARWIAGAAFLAFIIYNFFPLWL